MGDTAGELTLAAMLREHLLRSGLPADGGDTEPFAVVKLLGRIPYPIPNTKARKRAVKIHDLNHLVTGYLTDRKGELQISAWELASGGCQSYAAAWTLDLVGLFAGFFICPRLTVQAFLGGRSNRISIDTLSLTSWHFPWWTPDLWSLEVPPYADIEFPPPSTWWASDWWRCHSRLA